MTVARQQLGAHGEQRAADWYAAQGFVIVVRNWRTRHGEIDLVAGADGLIVFCEVKTRTSSAFGTGLEAVTWAKQQRLRRLGAAWLADHPDERRRAVRFDVASVVGDSIEVVEGAF